MKEIIMVVILSAMLITQQNTYQSQRADMVKVQLKSRGIENQAVLDAMGKIPREKFVLPEYVHRAYEDNALPIKHGQTISQPYIVAYMTEIIDPDAGDKVLEIGTGSGYQAAVLAEIVHKVFTVEIVPGLGTQARSIFQELGYENIEVKIGDGYHGWKEHAPYDAIIVTAAPEEIPQPLIDQLKEGGRMIIPVGPVFATQELILVRKENGRISKKGTFPVRFVPFIRE